MEIQISALASEALIEIYRVSDAEIKKKLIEGTPWDEIKDRIDFLTEVSKELGRRKISIKTDNTPANNQTR